MLEFIKDNVGTIVISLILIGIFALIIKSMIRDKKKGKSSCGCNCAHCAMAGACHTSKTKDN